jgi:hypothetical protein
MTMTQDLFALLSSGATAAGARVYPVIAPDLVLRPYIVYLRVTSNDENVLSGATGLYNTRIQLDMYADSYAAAQALAAQVDARMAGWIMQNVSLGAQDLYEPDPKLHRVRADYSVWHT